MFEIMNKYHISHFHLKKLCAIEVFISLCKNHHSFHFYRSQIHTCIVYVYVDVSFLISALIILAVVIAHKAA